MSPGAGSITGRAGWKSQDCKSAPNHVLGHFLSLLNNFLGTLVLPEVVKVSAPGLRLVLLSHPLCSLRLELGFGTQELVTQSGCCGARGAWAWCSTHTALLLGA